MLRLNTFGRLFLTRDGERLSGAAAQPRRLALLALLAAAGENGISRDRLLGMLWGETDEDRARRGLNQALYALRHEMGSDHVFIGTRDLRVNPEYLTSDLAVFGAAIKAGRLEQAADEYAGPFLDGLHLSDAPEFERWVEEERAGFARDYASALERLALQAAERGDPAAATGWWRRLAGQDPLNARVACALMEALLAAGDRPAALQHARVYEVLLAEELDAPPDRAVVALADRIRRQSASHAAFVDPPPAPVRAPPPVSVADTTTAPTVPAPVAPSAPPLDARHARVRLVGAALAGAAVAAAATFVLTRAPPPPPPGRILRITAEPGLEIHPALSPDGGFVAYAAGPTGRMRIFVRQLAGGRTVAVTEGVGGDQHWPRWSPDGSRITFEADHTIYVVPALGGPVKLLVPAPATRPLAGDEGPGYLAWSPDGERIAYAQEKSIYVRAVAGGPATRVVTVAPDPPHSLAWSPDGARIAFVRGNAAFVYASNAIGNIAPSAIWVVPASGGEATRVTDAAALNTSPVWMPGGRSLRFVSNRDGVRDVYEVEVGARGHEGRVRRITTGLLPHTIDVSRDARVTVYGAFTEYANVWSLPVGSTAPSDARAARPVTAGHQSVEGLAISADRRWLAFDSDRGGRQAIYRVAIGGGDPEQLSGNAGDDFMPAWSPDGKEIAYYGFRSGRRRLFVMPVEGGEPTPVVADSGNQRFPDWSPDGRHLVFHSDRTGRFELYVVDRDPAGRWSGAHRLTNDGGQEARWSPDGSAIVYVHGPGLRLIAPNGGTPRRLLDAGDSVGGIPLLAQWAPDGRRIYYKALNAEGVASFWSIPAAGGSPLLLARLDDPARPSPRAEFATDGERLYFTISERESDIWRIESAR